MADIRPFCAVRPSAGLEEKVAALPYDVYDRVEARAAALAEPLSFLNIDRPETQFPPEHDIYAPDVYVKARSMFDEQCAGGVYTREEKPCFYVYEQTWQGRSQTGLVACASADDYLSGIIKKHENTREDKEQDRIRHVDAMSAQTGPIFLAYRSDPEISRVIGSVTKKTPEYDFTGRDGVTHKGWKIEDEDSIAAIRGAFARISDIYIADGHHRCASAVKVCLKRRQENPGYDGTEDFNFFLCVLFPDEELMIMDYNRTVRDLNGMTEQAFLDRLAALGCGVVRQEEALRPARKGECAMYLPSGWYMVSFPDAWKSEDPVAGLDVSILQDRILGPLLGISDPRTDSRIGFIGGIRGYGELSKKVDEGWAVSFGMYPTSISELFAVADAGLLMPPKSTWFEPKLRSGLYIHTI